MKKIIDFIKNENLKNNFICEWDNPQQYKFYITYSHRGYGTFLHHRTIQEQVLNSSMYFGYESLNSILEFYKLNKDYFLEQMNNEQ